MMRKVYVAESGSTNTLMREVLKKGDFSSFFEGDFAAEQEDWCLYTFCQTAGRGQRGNSWECEDDKNLAISILLHPQELSAGQHFIVSKQVALAVAETVDYWLAEAGLTAAIKWPNDIYVGDQKISGILLENTLVGSRLEQCIAGIGLNINQEVFLSDAPNPVSLKQLTREDTNKEAVLDYLLARIEHWRQQPISETERHYQERLYRREGFYPYQAGEELFDARIRSVGQDGCLNLELKNGEKRGFYFKEVKFVVKNLVF